MRYIYCLIIVFSFLNVYCQNENDLLKRQPYKLKLPVEKKSVYEVDVAESPFVMNKNIVQIYPGETIYVEAEMVNDSMMLRSVKEIMHPERTITMTCTQAVNKGKHQSVLLKVTNPFDKALSYSGSMFLMKNNSWVPANVHPVQAKLSSFEIYPDVIITFGLSDWKFIQR